MNNIQSLTQKERCKIQYSEHFQDGAYSIFIQVEGLRSHSTASTTLRLECDRLLDKWELDKIVKDHCFEESNTVYSSPLEAWGRRLSRLMDVLAR